MAQTPSLNASLVLHKISSGNICVPLAGVLNVKTWLLLGKYSEWRWSDIDTTYWYNSVELLRVKEDVELKSILRTEVKPKLMDLIKKRK